MKCPTGHSISARSAICRSSYILCRCFFCFLFLTIPLGAKLTQDLPDRSSPSFQWMVDIWLQINDLTFFCRSLKGRCHDNQFWGLTDKIAKTHPHSVHWHSGMHNLTSAIISLLLVETCMVRGFRPVAPEFTRLNWIQEASISTQVSSTTFARDSDTARPGGLHAKLCHTSH